VTGAAFPFATNVQYRAWGAMKAMAYGNGRALTLGYNDRFKVSDYNIPGVLSKQYQYYADGRLQYSHDLIDQRFDRSYSYDHAARMVQALSGAEARGEAATDNRPYKQTFGYDAFNHLTSRVSHHWSAQYTDSATYNTHGRNTAWQYDADGNLLNDGDYQYTYDAAGRGSTSTGAKNIWQYFDGDGQRVKSRETGLINPGTDFEQPYDRITYFLRSSVLGGQVITELNLDGTKKQGYIYGAGGMLAWQLGNNQIAEWDHYDARRGKPQGD